ncbi:MAG: PepSY domain-containing protein, partial [Planctomycetaceae bacterium]|nr:PepSY domain-containing protein [Planctomycetaceae bacterium]
MSFQFFRRFFYEIHLWLGIICGIIVFLICLSGSILVFRDEINRFVDPGKFYVSVPADGQRLPVDEIITKLETKNPGMKVTSMTIPEQANRTILAMLSRPMPEGMR